MNGAQPPETTYYAFTNEGGYVPFSMVGSVASFPTLESGYCPRVNDQGEITGQWQMITPENEGTIIDLLISYDLEVTSINSNGGMFTVGDTIPYWDSVEIIA